MATFTFNFSPEQLATPTVSDFRDFPKVTNSGAYDVTIHQAALGERMVKGEARQTINLQLLATHLYLPDHKGRMYVNVDIPVDGKPNFYDHLFYELTYLTGCVTKAPNGASMLTLETQDVQLQNPNYAGETTLKVFPALQDKRLILVVRRSNGMDGRFWLNPVGFFSEQRLSLKEVLQGVTEPRDIELCSTTAEGFPLDVSRSNSTANNGGNGFSAPQAHNGGNGGYGGNGAAANGGYGGYGSRSAAGGAPWQGGAQQYGAPQGQPQGQPQQQQQQPQQQQPQQGFARPQQRPQQPSFANNGAHPVNPNFPHLQPVYPAGAQVPPMQGAPVVPQPVAMAAPAQSVGNNAMQRQFGPNASAPAGNGGGAMSAASVLNGAPVNNAPTQNRGNDEVPF